jgi:hypothetical protein
MAMNSSTSYSNTKSFDSSPPNSSAHGLQLGRAIKAIGDKIATFLTTGNELHVWTNQQHGHVIWHVYDPMTEHKEQFSSEEELRLWLEQRYYQ